jgi:hypothetical protein
MLREKNIIGINICAVIVFFFIILIKDFLAGEEGRIKKFISEGRAAIVSKNILKCSEMVAMHYSDANGMDRSSLIYAVRQSFQYYEKFKINIEDIQIKLGEDKQTAEVDITAMMVGQTTKDAEEYIFEGEKGHFAIDIVKEERRWKLLKLEFYEPVKIMGQLLMFKN